MAYNFEVNVICMTYNHASYIEDALDGFVLQQTNFPFVCCIVDDASTDGEQDIIKRYLYDHFEIDDKLFFRSEDTNDCSLLFARHKSNHNCFFAVVLLKYNHYQINKSKRQYYSEFQDNARFIAVCEGDDYWIDSRKLQKQCDFMNSHPNCSLVTHLSYSLNNNVLSPFTTHVFESNNEYEISADQIISNHLLFHTSSLFFYVKDYQKHLAFLLKTGIIDFLLKFLFATDGEVHLIPEYMSVYRRMAIGSWSMRTLTDKNRYINHVQESIVKLRRFNEYRGGRYFTSIDKLIIKKEFEILIINNDIESLKKDPFLTLYRALPFKTKVMIFLRHYLCPS